MLYPMRSIRTNKYKLIHNLNYFAPFPIDQDFYLSSTFQDVLNRTINKLPLHWYKNLTNYYYRPEWELFDLENDKYETNNIYDKNKKKKEIFQLKKQLNYWLNLTNDPFICSPHHVLEDAGNFKTNAKCLPLANKL